MTTATTTVLVPPERVARWVGNVVVRHGELVMRVEDGALVGSAADGSTFTARLPFDRAYDGPPDSATFAWLCDVIVDEGHRGHRLSRRMLEALDQHPRLQSLRRWCLATRDAHGLYEKMGYVPVVPGAWMERKCDPSLWQDLA